MELSNPSKLKIILGPGYGGKCLHVFHGNPTAV